jgi:hypothetical protein
LWFFEDAKVVEIMTPDAGCRMPDKNDLMANNQSGNH